MASQHRKNVRRQVEFRLLGKTYKVRPTFATLEMIEQRLSSTLFFQRLYAHDVRASDMAWVYMSALTVQGVEPPDFEDIGDSIIEDGLVEHVPQVSDIISALLEVGPEKPLPKSEAAEADGESEATEKTGGAPRGRRRNRKRNRHRSSPKPTG